MTTARLQLGAVLLATVVAGCGGEDEPDVPLDPCNLPTPTAQTPPLHTPRWAFEPWISKDISTGADTYAFVDGFQSRDIPVGVVVLDSPWETNYNTLIPNPERYPDFDQMVKDLRASGVRMVLWTTQMVNFSSFDLEIGGDFYDGPASNWEEGERCGFFVDDSQTWGWWKGLGAGIDFFNPKAVAWWRRQQNALLDAGVAGFKLDFGEQYIESDPISTAAGPIPKQEYSEKYYEDFFIHGVARAGKDEFVTMVRPWDESYQWPARFFARPEHAPVAWVGDNRRDWVGLADALDHIFRSAKAGYIVIGSDLGGYLDRDDKDLTVKIPFSQENFARWTGVAAMTPFMQLHGRANLEPWAVPERPDETVELYRYWATLHHELVPFFYSLSEEAIAGAPVILRPIGDEADWPGDYRFQVGDAFLVAPLLDDTGKRDVPLPAGARWVDWWTLDAAPHDGGTTLTAYDATDRRRIPLFLREGAIVPLTVDRPLTGLGTAASAGALTVLSFPGATESTFVLHDMDDKTTTIAAKLGSMTLSRAPSPVIVRLVVDAAPSTVTESGSALTAHAARAAFDAAESGYFVESARALWVKVPARASGGVAITWQ